MIPHTTLHEQLRQLERAGAIARRVFPGPPCEVDYRLSPGGERLGQLVDLTEAWLRARPGAYLAPRSYAAWKAVAALVETWTTGITAALTAATLTRRELGEMLAGPVSQDELRTRLDRLVAAGIVGDSRRGRGTTTRYALSEWGRRGIGVLAFAAGWERRRIPDLSVPVTVEDGVNAIRAAMPLVTLPRAVAGVCALTVQTNPETGPLRARLAWVVVAQGRVLAGGGSVPPRGATAWAKASMTDWLKAVIDRRPGVLRSGGDVGLVTALVEDLHRQLYVYG